MSGKSLLTLLLLGTYCIVRTVDAARYCPKFYPKDCGDIKRYVNKWSGVYTIYVGPQKKPADVYCDMRGKAWTVFQRRIDGSEIFYRRWTSYVVGFGNRYREFWLGNDALHLLTSHGKYRLRVDLADFEGQNRYAEYSSFSVASAADGYKLTVGGYSGNAGDCLWFHSGMKFSTYDHDNDISVTNCARDYQGAWWYNKCHWSNLNGLYLGGPNNRYAVGVVWGLWRGNNYSLRYTEMKVQSK